MAQRYDITRITFQANAGPANAAIESLRKTAEDCSTKVTKLKKDLAAGIKMGKSTEELDKIRASLKEQEKLQRVFQKGYQELIKGARTLDQAIEAFNNGSLNRMSAAFQKAANNAAKLWRGKLDPTAESYKAFYSQLTALMDATQQNYARLQTDAQQMIETLRKGGKVSTAALNEELKAQRELLSVMSETDKGYKQTERIVAELDLYLKKMGGDYEFIRQNITDTKKVSDDMLRNMYNELEQVNREGKVTQKIMQENAAAMKEIRAEQARRVESVLGGNLGQQSEQSIRSQISVAKELLATYKTGSKEAQTLSAQIVNAEEHLKTHGVEAARAAQRETQQIKTQEEAEKQLQSTMNKRMTSLKTLSAAALAETRKYWEAQVNGADLTDAKLKKYEANLQKIIRQERERKVAQLDSVLKNPSGYGIAEVRNAVQEMEKLRDSMKQGIPQWQHYNKMVEQGKTYLDQLAKTEAAQKIASQMQNLTTLSAQGLREVKKYWETMVAGAAHGSDKLTEYEAKLNEVTAEEQRRMELQAQSKVSILGGDLEQYSEAEIRKAIEAGQQLIQTYKTADPEAKKLAQNIVAAEQHLKQYGVEAERTAQREAEALRKAAEQRRQNDALMKQQLQKQGAFLSESALKAQQQYWQRLIDDPKTAAASLQEYKQRLQEVQSAQQTQVQIAGQKALAFFRGDTSNASADQIKQNTEALKKYRDSLPQQTNADIIAEINSYITKTGEAAKVAAGEVMSLSDAEALAGKLGTQGFTASTDKLKMAKKALEEARDAAGRGSARFTELQDKINKVDIELAKTGEIAKSVQDTLDQPKGKSINELKQAVEQGRVALNAMDRSTKEGQKQFDELAKKIKEADFELKRLTGSAKGSASAFDKAWSRLKTYIGLYVGAAVAMQKITATMGDLMELSDKMGEVRKTTGFTADEVGRLSDNLKKLDVRTSLTSLMELSSLAGSVGLKTQEDVQGFTEAANQLMIALPEMGNESARTLIKIAQATGDLQKNNNDVRETLEKVGSTIIALRANSASAAGPITDFVSRVGAVGAQAGISIDQIAALGSTIDALGGRVEMSATALSRMIPAIRNNAFGVANAIGVTEKTLTDLFNQGKAMEAMVLIFEKMRESVKQFDTTTEEGQEAMAKNVEELLGKNAAMADVMKELNQQGARAGIVFGLLSQNVDELKEQLGIAGEAYRNNIALQEEFNKMNDTTAAKWERLKNQLEEMFVSDSAQRGLGWIIDKLRDIVDLLSGSSGLSVAIRSILIYLALVKVQLVSIAAGALKSLLSGLKSIGVMLGFIKGEMTALQWGNIFTAAAAAIWLAVEALGTFRHKAAEAFKEAGKWAQKIVDAEQAVESNFKAVEKANGGLDEANKKLKEAKTALEKAKKAMDGSKESADRLKKAEEDLSKAEQDVAKAEDSHRAAIDNINKIYGKYLGFTLSEVSSKKELAAAQELVNSKLREELTLKQRSAALSRVEDEMGGERDQAFGAMSQALGNVFRKKVQVKRGKGQEQTGWANDTQRNAELLRQMTKMAQEQKLSAEQIEKALSEAGVSIYETSAGSKKRISAYGASLRNVILNYSKEFHEVKEKVAEVETQFDVELSIDREKQQENLQRQYQQSEKTYAQLEQKHAKAKGDAKKKAAADLLKQADTLQDMIKNAGNFYKLDNKAEKQAYDKFISDTQKRIDGIEEQREALLKEAGELYKPQAGSSSSINTKSDKPYGTFNRVTNPYEKWDADSLVARRKEMLERVRALANGADVQKVLSEDAKFITEATRKNIKTTKDAIEWYNQERLKIQEALHARYLTNTGDWMDPKKVGKKASKMVQDEMKYYLDELDAYYTERKTMIQEARNDEQISEGEAWRRTLQNEAERQQRRAELQQLYAKKSAKVTQEEQNAIFEILSERTDDRVEYIKQDIENTVKFIEKIGKEKGKPAMDRIIGDIDLGIEKAFLKQRTAVSKQMDAIADIVNKERPYNGITENLQENLTKMGILQADFEKQRLALLANRQDTSELDKKYAAEIPQRLSFLLNEAESAYTLTVEELMKRLADKGMQAWADELSKNPTMQQALLAHLRLTYDKIQDAIKKEASLIKKEVDIWWADIAPGADQSRKDGFERILSQLGQLSDSMSHANQLIGAGAWSERVADKLAIKQMEVRLAMQTAYYNKMRQIGEQEIQRLKEAGREEDAEHLQKSLNLAITQEQVKLDEQRVAIANRLEESQNRLYTSLKEWSELIASSIQGVFEASNTGLGEFYTEQAKKRLTGAATSGTYIVVNDAGTKKAEASYETLTDEEVLKIEQRNAQADAWKKMMDDLNMKMSDMITDQINAFLQNASIDANTDALGANTEALLSLTSAMTGGSSTSPAATAAVPTVPDTTTETVVQGAQKRVEATVEANKKITASTQSAFAKMTQAANLYGIAYQAMSNDNMNAAQKFGMIALQTAGNMAMAALTADWSKNSAEVAGSLPAILAKCLKISPIWGSVIFAGLTGLLGGAMGVAAGKIAKSKSEIAQATGAGVQAGRLATGMLTYAEGNVNEFSDPSSLTPGRQYNVDGADGRTYRARYMGKDAKTHITNGPEFHLVGEKGREAIIDAKTTRQIQMNDPEIWRSIQVLYNGGSLSHTGRRGRGVRTFAAGNIDEFDTVLDGSSTGGMDMAAMQASLDRNSAATEALVAELAKGIKSTVSPYGKDGIVHGYDRGKAEAKRHGLSYIP